MSNYKAKVSYPEPIKAKDAYTAAVVAYGKTEDAEKALLDKQTKALGRGINGMGQGIALEVLAALGQWLNKEEWEDA